MLDNEIKSFIKMLGFTNGRYSETDMFKDIVTLEAYLINVSMLLNEHYSKEFDKLMSKYDEKEQKQIWHILLKLTELYKKQKEYTDIMTLVFAELGLGNKHTRTVLYTYTYFKDDGKDKWY